MLKEIKDIIKFIEQSPGNSYDVLFDVHIMLKCLIEKEEKRKRND